MGQVANSLLDIGEENVNGNSRTHPSTADTEDTSNSHNMPTGDSEDRRTDCDSAREEDCGEKNVRSDEETIDSSSHREEVSEGSECTQDESPRIQGAEEDSAERSGGEADAQNSSHSEIDDGTEPKTAVATSTEDSFEKAMASAAELEEKWFLTFEQFVGALQREPFICQFFAEQNSIDLSGSNVDPVLNPYTRTIMATSP